ncbi:glutathionylspermidine synthase group 1-like protein [Acinetobacter phage AB1I1M-1]
MKRHSNFEKRLDYVEQLEGIGFNYWNAPSGPEKLPYWQEGVVYGFAEHEIDQIQQTTQELHDMSIEMVDQVVTSGDYPEYFKLTEMEKSLIETSWKRNDPTLYGRFDLAYGVDGSLKMFEYNGDTPVSILECSVAQWNYIEQMKSLPEELRIQYNMIDETLSDTWKKYFEPGTLLHFASSGGFRHEDFGNLVYIMDNALRSGMNVKEIQMQDIGLMNDNGNKSFVDLQNQEMKNIFKLYPWEWMTEEEFGKQVNYTNTQWLEPAWKMLLSNKSMLIKLWEMFENHPNLLPSFITERRSGTWAKKAIHGREGSNIYKALFADNQNLATELAQGSHKVPEYDHWGYMYQQWFDIKPHDGYYPIIGSWVIGDTACGMSIREDENLVTGMDAFFASHIFVPEEFEGKYENLWK